MEHRLEKTDFASIIHWREDDHDSAFAAFLASAHYMQKVPYKTRALGVDGTAVAKAGAKAISAAQGNLTKTDIRTFFETDFTPHRVVPSDNKAGFLTGFYEPEIDASPIQTSHYSTPLYRRPPDLIDIDDSNRPAGMDMDMRFAMNSAQGIRPYYDRAEINAGALAGQDLELAWLEDPVDAFFIHVQGAARLRMTDGKLVRITFDGKSGYPYSSLGKHLCQRLNVPPESMTADVLAQWMKSHRDVLPELLAHNRSYIFFKEVMGQADEKGPIAAAKVPLTAGRSLAVDRLLHTFGTPIWISSQTSLPGETAPLARLMVAQDTGSAIIGPVRGDIFTGSGAKAGLQAGRVRQEIEMIVLVPNR